MVGGRRRRDHGGSEEDLPDHERLGGIRTPFGNKTSSRTATTVHGSNSRKRFSIVSSTSSVSTASGSRSEAERKTRSTTGPSSSKGRSGYEKAKSHRYENINDNDDPNVLNESGFQFAELDYRVEKILLPIKRLVEANGEKLFVNLCYVDFGKHTKWKGNLSHARQPLEYAELIHVTFEHLKRKYGIVPDALEIVLEPENSEDWRGREIGAAMVAAAKRLNAGRFSSGNHRAVGDKSLQRGRIHRQNDGGSRRTRKWFRPFHITATRGRWPASRWRRLRRGPSGSASRPRCWSTCQGTRLNCTPI